MKKAKIQHFKCTSCDLSIRVKVMYSYVCPHCGEMLIPLDEKYKKALENRMVEVDDKSILETIEQENKILDIIKKPIFDELNTQIKSLMEILKDPSTSFGIKAAIAAAFLYLLSPVDIIPDIIPIFGYVDDISILLLTLNFIREQSSILYNNYNLRSKINYQSSPIIYSVFRDKGNRECNYFEEKGRRIWQLSADELIDRGYQLINGALVKAPENYIRHPYTSKLLVPTSTYDRQLSDTLVEEITTLARIFGAKDVELEISEYKYEKKGGGFLLKAKEINLKNEGSYEDKSYSKTYYKKQFDKFEEINLNDVNSLIWIFTNEYVASIRLAQERLFNGIKYLEYQTLFDSENIMQIDAKNQILKKNDLGVSIKFSNSIKKNIKVKINFHDIPEHIYQQKDDIYNNFKYRLEQQKLDLV